MKFSVSYFLLFLFALGCKQVSKVETQKIPKEFSFKNQNGYVNDFDDVFTLEQENNLEKIFADYDHQTTNEVAVVTVNNIQPFQNINDFNDALLSDWRFGKDDQFNGLIFLLNKDNRSISIRFGTGIQKKLTDAETQSIIDSIIVSEFKNGCYYNGILKGFEAIKTELK